MNSGLSPADPTLVAAFRSALLHQGLIALLIITFLGPAVGHGAGVAALRPDGAGGGEPGEPVAP